MTRLGPDGTPMTPEEEAYVKGQEQPGGLAPDDLRSILKRAKAGDPGAIEQFNAAKADDPMNPLWESIERPLAGQIIPGGSKVFDVLGGHETVKELIKLDWIHEIVDTYNALDKAMDDSAKETVDWLKGLLTDKDYARVVQTINAKTLSEDGAKTLEKLNALKNKLRQGIEQAPQLIDGMSLEELKGHLEHLLKTGEKEVDRKVKESLRADPDKVRAQMAAVSAEAMKQAAIIVATEGAGELVQGAKGLAAAGKIVEEGLEVANTARAAEEASAGARAVRNIGKIEELTEEGNTARKAVEGVEQAPKAPGVDPETPTQRYGPGQTQRLSSHDLPKAPEGDPVASSQRSGPGQTQQLPSHDLPKAPGVDPKAPTQSVHPGRADQMVSPDTPTQEYAPGERPTAQRAQAAPADHPDAGKILRDRDGNTIGIRSRHGSPLLTDPPNPLNEAFGKIEGAQREAVDLAKVEEKVPGARAAEAQRLYDRYKEGVDLARKNLKNPEWAKQLTPDDLQDLERATLPENQRTLEDFRRDMGLERTKKYGPGDVPTKKLEPVTFSPEAGHPSAPQAQQPGKLVFEMKDGTQYAEDGTPIAKAGSPEHPVAGEHTPGAPAAPDPSQKPLVFEMKDGSQYAEDGTPIRSGGNSPQARGPHPTEKYQAGEGPQKPTTKLDSVQMPENRPTGGTPASESAAGDAGGARPQAMSESHRQRVLELSRNPEHIPEISEEQWQRYSDAVTRAREAAGGPTGSCEKARAELQRLLSSDVTGDQGKLAGVIDHEFVVTKEGLILDPVARQAVKQKLVSDVQLRIRGLYDAVKEGVFTPKQWQEFNALGRGGSPNFPGSLRF
jgi:hypothetical protein